MTTSRREFLRRTTAGCTAALALSPDVLRAAEQAPRVEVSADPLTILAYDARGEPLPASALQGLFLFEVGGDRSPLPHPTRNIAPGRVQVEVPGRPCGFAQMSAVEGFGTARLYADAEGRGYGAGQTVDLNRELAASRRGTVNAAIEQARQEGVVLPPALTQRLAQARALLGQADAAAGDPRRAVPLAMESLRESLWAGEEVVLARARHSIARRGPRKGFLFGCNFFGYPQQGEAYAERFAALFNFATLPLYWRSFEPEEGKPRFAQVDARLARLETAGVTAKGHPLCWFHEAG